MSETELGDETLVEHANRGDEAAFEAIYRRHRDWVLRLAWRFTGDRDEALDVLQDAFAHLFGKFPGFVLTGSLRGYLYPTVKHLSITRARRARPTVDIDLLADRLPSPTAPAGDSAAELAGDVAALPAAQRHVILLRFAHDLSLQEIAVALAIPLGTVKSRLHNALDALRRRRAGR